MSELISRQKAIDILKNMMRDCFPEAEEELDAVITTVREIPSAEPERKKGEWLLKPNIYGVAYCSGCDYELHTNNTNFCPNCGADMRAKGNENV